MNARSCLSGRRLSVFLLGLYSLVTAALAGDDVDASAVTLPRRFDLATARELAINHSRVIAQARERIREQEGVIIEAKAAKKPRVDLNTNYDATGENRIESGLEHTDYNNPLEIGRMGGAKLKGMCGSFYS